MSGATFRPSEHDIRKRVLERRIELQEIDSDEGETDERQAALRAEIQALTWVLGDTGQMA